MWLFQSLPRINSHRYPIFRTAKFSSLGSQTGSDFRNSIRSNQIGKTLDRIKERDGLKPAHPNIQYLIGRTSEVGGDSGGLDLGDKTQSILQSSHPVGYVIQREISNWDLSNSQKLNYHNWVTILGRSLIPTLKLKENDLFQSQLDCIANAAESGMFSSDVHHTVVDIPSGGSSSSQVPDEVYKEMNLGNKYAALVGDYFAVKAIFFAERARRSEVILSITRGVEDFTSAGFSTRLLDPQCWTPFLPFPKATLKDWEAYNVKASGYFTGGCYAVLNVLPHNLLPASKIMKLVTNLTLFLKTVKELDDLGSGMDSLISPFLLTSLPGILYQQIHPNAYEVFHVHFHHKDNSPLTSEMSHIRREILSSDVMQQALEMMQHYAQIVKSELLSISPSDFYSSAFRDLVDVVIANTSNPNATQ